MSKKFLKKIIAQSQDDLRVISALCSDAIIKASELKYLKKNKVFLVPLLRQNRENNLSKNTQSIVKFEYVESSKSKNLTNNPNEKLLNLLAIDLFKQDKNFEIALLFSNNKVITLVSEVIEVTLEDIAEIND
ncbi:MAG: DUF2948 family protein [Rickettsiales bacterium TMED289]|nr:MAG: DUF2948 family protein [Rickettsiales bacterium TMED289]|tara:strand:- start:2023 stop:2418 length:396 start_codon:yes stop_codon:yes gene_type:complete